MHLSWWGNATGLAKGGVSMGKLLGKLIGNLMPLGSKHRALPPDNHSLGAGIDGRNRKR